MKIYLNNKEAEQLCFQKIVILDRDLSLITKAQKGFIYSIEVNAEPISTNFGEVILFSIVKKIEVPEVDQNLFLTQFRIPKGMLTLSKRQAREVEYTPKLPIDKEVSLPFSIGAFQSIRRALVACVTDKFGGTYTKKNLSDLLADKLQPGALETNFAKQIIKNDGFPQLQVKANEYAIESVHQFVWWGKIIAQDYFKEEPEFTPEQVAQRKQWIGSFNPANFDANTFEIAEIPTFYQKDIEIILGYYFAILKNSQLSSEQLFALLEKQLHLQTEIKQQIYLWALFFSSFALVKYDYIYPTIGLKNEFHTIEQKVLSVVTKGEYCFETQKYPKEIKNYSKEERMESYFDLMGGRAKQISEEEVLQSLQKSNFNSSNLDNFGAVNDRSLGAFIEAKKDHFLLSGYLNKPSTYCFYENENQEILKGLRNNKVKLLAATKLSSSKCKHLFTFIEDDFREQDNLLPSLLAYYLKEENKRQQSLTCVWVLDQLQDKRFDTSFASLRNELEQRLQREANREVQVVLALADDLEGKELNREISLLHPNVSLTNMEIADNKIANDKLLLMIAKASKKEVIQDKKINFDFILNW